MSSIDTELDTARSDWEKATAALMRKMEDAMTTTVARTKADIKTEIDLGGMPEADEGRIFAVATNLVYLNGLYRVARKMQAELKQAGFPHSFTQIFAGDLILGGSPNRPKHIGVDFEGPYAPYSVDALFDRMIANEEPAFRFSELIKDASLKHLLIGHPSLDEPKEAVIQTEPREVTVEDYAYRRRSRRHRRSRRIVSAPAPTA